nr:helix-turn-helix domain-containing protein [Testudinibacter sp. TR-2022]
MSVEEDKIMAITTAKMLAHALKEFRYQNKLSQSQVALLAGVKQATVSAFENQPERSKVETLFNLLSALELEITLSLRNKSTTLANNQVQEPTPDFDDEDW